MHLPKTNQAAKRRERSEDIELSTAVGAPTGAPVRLYQHCLGRVTEHARRRRVTSTTPSTSSPAPARAATRTNHTPSVPVDPSAPEPASTFGTCAIQTRLDVWLQHLTPEETRRPVVPYCGRRVLRRSDTVEALTYHGALASEEVRMRVCLPIWRRGCGIRSRLSIAPAAFCSTFHTSCEPLPIGRPRPRARVHPFKR